MRIIKQFADAAGMADGEIYVCDMEAMLTHRFRSGDWAFVVEQANRGVKGAFLTQEAAIEYAEFLTSKQEAVRKGER